MASGIIMKRRPVPKPPFQPPASFGINRVPEPRPLDLDNLLSLGTDLVARSWDEVRKACGLFRRLDELARVNRRNLENEEVVQVLTDLRKEAEVSLERGFYAFDVAMEVLWRLKGYNPVFGERVDREFRTRQKNYYHVLGGVAGRAYLNMYRLVEVTPTTGDLSAVPPGLHFDEAAVVACRWYGSRYHVAMGNMCVEATSHWRRRLVRGIESGVLPGRILGGSGRPTGAGGGERMEDVIGEVEGDSTWVRNELASLAGSDSSSLSPPPDSESSASVVPGRRVPLSTIAEEDETEGNEAIGPVTTSLNNQTQGPVAMSSQVVEPPEEELEGGRRASMRVRNKKVAALTDAAAPQTPPPSASVARPQVKNPRKRAREFPEIDSDSEFLGAKRARWEQRLRFSAEKGQDMSPLTVAELDRLPWNDGLLDRSEDDDYKAPEFLPESEQAQATVKVPPLRAWGQYQDPIVDFGYEPEGTDYDESYTEDLPGQQSFESSARGSAGVRSDRNSSTPAHPAGEFRSSPPEPTLPEVYIQGGTNMEQGPGPDDTQLSSGSHGDETTQALSLVRIRSSTEPSTGASQTPAPSSSHESTFEATATQVISTSPLPPQGYTGTPPLPETPSLNPPRRSLGQDTEPSGSSHLSALRPYGPWNRVETPPGGTPDMSFGSIFTPRGSVSHLATPGSVVSDAPSGFGDFGRRMQNTHGSRVGGPFSTLFPPRTPTKRFGALFNNPSLRGLGSKVTTPASAVSDASSGFGGPSTWRAPGRTAPPPAGEDLDDLEEGSVEDLDEISVGLDEISDDSEEDMGEGADSADDAPAAPYHEAEPSSHGNPDDTGEKEHEKVQKELSQREKEEKEKEEREKQKKEEEALGLAMARRFQEEEEQNLYGDIRGWKERSNNIPTLKKNKDINEDEWEI